MKITRRKGPLIVVCSILIIVPTFLSFSHYVQLPLMKHIPLKEFIIKSIVANQNLNISDSMYGSFFNRSGNTMDAIDTLDALNALTEINKDAVLTFLIVQTKQGHSMTLSYPVRITTYFVPLSSFTQRAFLARLMRYPNR